jgi:hypothetical protein
MLCTTTLATSTMSSCLATNCLKPQGSVRFVGSSYAQFAFQSPSQSTACPMAVLANRTYNYILQLLDFDRLAYPDHNPPVMEALKDVSYTSYPSIFQLRQYDVEALTFVDYDVYPPIRRHLPMGDLF